MMKDKKSKIMFGVIIGLVLVIGVLTAVIISLSGKKDDKTGNDDTVPSVSTEAATESAKDEGEDTSSEESTEAASKDVEMLYYASISDNSSWQENGKNAATKNVIIYNKDKKDVTGWKIELVFASEPELADIWGGKAEVNGDTITVVGYDYTAELKAGGNVNFGFNVKADDVTVKDYRLYINGELYTGTEKKETETEEAEAEAESKKKPEPESGTPVENHGKLSVNGTDLVDKNGDKYQLKGLSTHGMTWFPQYVSEETFKTLRDDWGANLIRLAMYTDTGDSYGYCSGGDKAEIKKLLDDGVGYASDLGMYVIIDWHILNDNNPNNHIEDAKDFFNTVSKEYAEYDNVLYEICNEPNGGTTWTDVKSYAETIIPVIRANDKDAIIIVGTPTWSQDVDIASEDPVTGYDNIMYAAHFYAATHKQELRDKISKAIDNGLPVFISEFSICDASGNGAIDYNEADAWFEFIDKYNLSYASWSLSNKAETASLFSSSSTTVSDFSESDISDTGKYIRDKILGN